MMMWQSYSDIAYDFYHLYLYLTKPSLPHHLPLAFAPVEPPLRLRLRQAQKRQLNHHIAPTY